MLKKVIVRIVSTALVVIAIIALIYSFPHKIKTKNIENVEIFIKENLETKEYYITKNFKIEFVKELNGLNFKRYFGKPKEEYEIYVVITYKNGKKIEVDPYKRIITEANGRQRKVKVKCRSNEVWSNFIDRYFESRIKEK